MADGMRLLNNAMDFSTNSNHACRKQNSTEIKAGARETRKALEGCQLTPKNAGCSSGKLVDAMRPEVSVFVHFSET